METKICLMITKEEAEKINKLLKNVDTDNVSRVDIQFMNKFLKDLQEVLN